MTMRTVFRLIAYLRYNWRAAILAYVCLIGTVLTSVVQPLVIKQVIDVGIAHRNGVLLVAASGIVVAVALVLGGFEYGQQYLSQYLSQTVAMHIRDDLYDTVQHQSFAFHDRNETGQLMSRAT